MSKKIDSVSAQGISMGVALACIISWERELVLAGLAKGWETTRRKRASPAPGVTPGDASRKEP